jgi:hypothetical protein
MSAWAEWRRRTSGRLEPREWTLYVHNSGETPAYQVVVTAESLSGPRECFRMGVVAGGSTADYVLTDKVRYPPEKPGPSVELFFRTSDGRLWHRRANGSLRSQRRLPEFLPDGGATRVDEVTSENYYRDEVSSSAYHFDQDGGEQYR